jgi:hypothetical protein
MADDDPSQKAGGTNVDGRQKMLGESGVPASAESASDQDVQQGVAEGKGVVTGHDAGKLWGDSRADGMGHAVVPTGFKYGPDGRVQKVHVNDTGKGVCGAEYTPEQFFGSRRTWTNITKDPVVKT